MLRTLLAALVACVLFVSASPVPAEEEVKKPPTPAVPIERGGSLISAGRLVIEPSVSYSSFSRDKVSVSGFTIFDAILIGRINVGKIQRNIICPGLSLRYGLKDLELSTRIPYMMRTDEESFPAGDTMSHFSATDGDLGDIEMASFYHLLSEGPIRPDIVFGITGKTVTGRDPYGLKKEASDNASPRLIQFPTGSGHWGVSGTVIFVKTSDPAVLFLNTTYFYNFSRNVGSISGSNYGDISPGASIEYQFGMVIGLNEKLAINMAMDQRITWDSMQNGRKMRDSGANAVIANFGMTYAFSNKFSVDVVWGLGMTDDAPDFTIGLRLPITILL
jgi:hypothetical protein